MQKIGLNVMVINGDTLAEGHLRGEDLWAKARGDVTISMHIMNPEQLSSKGLSLSKLYAARSVFAKANSIFFGARIYAPTYKSSFARFSQPLAAQSFPNSTGFSKSNKRHLFLHARFISASASSRTFIRRIPATLTWAGVFGCIMHSIGHRKIQRHANLWRMTPNAKWSLESALCPLELIFLVYAMW
jgi:hypothetical protein